VRRNAVIMPFYSITMPLMFFVGLAATLILPGLPNGDLADANAGAEDFPGLVPRLDRRGWCSHGNGSGRSNDSDRSNAIREEPVPSDSLAQYDRSTGCETGQSYRPGDHCCRAVLRDL